MTPSEVRDVRRALGLQQAELAQILGLGPNGRVTVGRWETDGAGPSGPASVALTYLAQGVPNEGQRDILTEHLFAQNEAGRSLILRLWRPRFIAQPVVGGDSLEVVMWIDDPAATSQADVQELLAKAETARSAFLNFTSRPAP